jgi:hypothetical protein
MTTAAEHQNAIVTAALTVEVAHLKLAVADLRVTNAQQNAKLDELLLTLNQARGGWRVLMAVGGAGVGLATGVNWVLTHWRG